MKLSVLIEAYLQRCICDTLIRTCIGEVDCQKPQKYEQQRRHECSELTVSTLTPRLLPSPSHQDSYPLHTKTPPFILTLNSSLHTKTPITLTPRLLPSPSYQESYHPHTKTPPFTLTLNSSLQPHTKTAITLTPTPPFTLTQRLLSPHTKTPPFILTLNSSLHPHTKTPPITLTTKTP